MSEQPCQILSPRCTLRKCRLSCCVSQSQQDAATQFQLVTIGFKTVFKTVLFTMVHCKTTTWHTFYLPTITLPIP